MGRHVGDGEDPPRNRRKRKAEPAPKPGHHDEPIGRRLRPEESATTETQIGFPATAETQTGFPRSEWSVESELSDPIWPEEEQRSGGRTKKVLLAVAAVAVVLGGTVIGIQAMTGSSGSSAGCPSGGCVTGASNQPIPQTAVTESLDEPTTGEEPEEKPEKEPEEETAKASPTPTPTVTRRRTGATSGPRRTPTPTPTATRAPRPTDEAPTDEASFTDEPEPSPSITSEPLVVDRRTQNPVPSPAVTEPAPTEAFTPAPVGGAAISVGFDLVSERARTYTVELVIVADESLTDLTLSLPVRGEVFSVTGAEWEQVDDILVIESAEELETGEELVVTLTAHGRAELPETCESNRGECAVV